MAGSLRQIGLGLVAGAACIALASAVGWVPSGTFDPWVVPALGAGVAVFALGVLGTVLGRVARMVRRGRCVRCGSPIERGQTYCIDHLRETVDEYRDHRPGARR